MKQLQTLFRANRIPQKLALEQRPGNVRQKKVNMLVEIIFSVRRDKKQNV